MDKEKIVVKTSIYKDLWEKIESYAQRHDEDIDTALRKLLVKGLFEETKKEFWKIINEEELPSEKWRNYWGLIIGRLKIFYLKKVYP